MKIRSPLPLLLLPATSRRTCFLGALAFFASMASAASAPSTLAPVNLGSTAHFAVLAGSLVSNIPGSAINGDIGLSPAAGSKVTGFGSTEVTGTIFTADATGPAGSVTAASDLTTAKGDLTKAYDDAAGRTPIPAGAYLNPGAGNLGGMTLTAGLYKFTGGLSITGSDLTLTGSKTDVWIFQIASDLVVGNGIKVTLAGEAEAANIFWQVGTSATLGTTSAFKGTIMADQSISLNTGASLEGRALASIAAVTLASNAITRPTTVTAILDRAAPRANTLRRQSSYRFDPAMATAIAVPTRGGPTLKLMNMLGRDIAGLSAVDAEANTR